MTSFAGSEGRAWIVGAPASAHSIAEFFSGDSPQMTRMGRIRRTRVPGRSLRQASEGAVAIVGQRPNKPGFAELADKAVEVPSRIRLRKTLSGTPESVMAELKTSTTREDLRRIRRAGFTYRITSDPEDIRKFHSRYYVPLVRQRFPEDGVVTPLEGMLRQVRHGGELVCADLDGEWVAGILNKPSEHNYSMGALGIRDADETVRQKRVVSALLVRSIARAVELGKSTTTLGSSLPFLGIGPIWFKAKWGCVLECDPADQRTQVLLDLRHAPVRAALAASPLIHWEKGRLSVSAWLPPGEDALNTLLREAGRFQGLSRWHVLADAETLDAAGKALAANDRIVPIATEIRAARPLWLGQLTAGAGA